MPTRKLRPFKGNLADAALMAGTTGKPTLSGLGTHNYACSECGFIVIRGFDHSQYRIGKGAVFKCGQCGALNEMPTTGIPAGDPAKQILIEVGKPRPGSEPRRPH